MLGTTTRAARVTSGVTGPEPLSGRAPLVQHLSPPDLARRWQLSHRTLERWRRDGRGPAHLKLGTLVLYRVEDVEAYEAAQWREGRNSRAVDVPAPPQGQKAKLTNFILGALRGRRSSDGTRQGRLA